ncbi:LysE family translocator [Maribacter sp. 2210JD10-5]|uniref:LysE family translocator n=1 Tax=Maribacter sp. 2210JD10-5 TaxID=3386272 RepID=UPI0039BD0CB9
MDYTILIAFCGATAALAISPGPDNIFVLIQSVSHGKKYGLATMAGLMTGCLVHTTLLAFGVSALIKNNPNIFLGIKVFGALYLLYLAYKVFKYDSTVMLSRDGGPRKSLSALFRQGFIMNVLNPKVTIFFLAFFPGFLFSETLGSVVQFYVLGFLFILVSSLIFGSIALLSGFLASRLDRNEKVGLVLKWLQILVFVAIAIYLFVES